MLKRIEELKREKNAVVMAHYYAPAEVQRAADWVGDSFYLAKVAKQSPADVIVFCGVSFMGESAKILCPDKKVLVPAPDADCPMAHMVAEGRIEEMREKYEDLAVVCYINSTAELKCKSDVCVTSSNAVKIVRALPNKNIFFIPDENLGRFIAGQVPEKNIIINDGCCPIHARISADRVRAEKERHPGAIVLAHPECDADTLSLADFIGSTAEMADLAAKSDAAEFIVCTEVGINRRLTEDSPDKRFFFPEPTPCCRDMKLNTLEGIVKVLETGENEVAIDEDVRRRALVPLERMLELAK